MKKKKVKALQYVRYDVQIDSGSLICSIPNLEYGYYDTWIDDNGNLMIEVGYGSN
jgi:hypothetical protein